MGFYATDVDKGCKILDKLMKLGKGGGDGSDSKAQVPCFQLSTDTQCLSNEKNINGPIDILLFEGWRVGIDHPNFLISTIMLIRIKVRQNNMIYSQ